MVRARPQPGSGSGSARQVFADRLGELFEAAGKPTLDHVVRTTVHRMRAARGPGRREPVTAQRISDWRAGRNLPNTFESVEPVLVTLFSLTKAKPGQIREDLIDRRTWERLWASADEEAPMRARRPGSAKPASDSGLPPRPRVVSALRRDVATFVGRDRELHRILHAAGPGRVVSIHTIDGMAGVGKTALATRAAHELKADFPDGQYFVELHAYTPGQDPADPSEVLAGLLTGLGVDPRYLPDTLHGRRDMWRDRLADKRVLLVLDDARDHAQIEPLLPAGDRCMTLVTSRRRLVALDGALPLALDILEPDTAIDLFSTLADRHPETNTDRAALRQIVSRCGFLPLAIALLAGRLAHHPTWTIAALADHFTAATDRLAELDVGDRAVHAAFDLSYHGLTPQQRLVFRRLGLHPGPDADADAAAALADIPVAVAGRELEALYTDHLLDETRPNRYRQHDLLRDYARTLTTTDPADDTGRAVDRLLDYYQHTAATADRHVARRTRPTTSHPNAPSVVRNFGDDIQALAWLRAERRNLLACLDRAADQPARIVELTATLAGLLDRDGPWPEARQLHQHAATAAQRLGDHLGYANALTNLGLVRERTGDYGDAADLHQQALTSYQEIGNRLGEANALLNLGVVHWDIGDRGKAAELYKQALTVYQDIGNRLGEANTLTNLGVLQGHTGDYRQAAELHGQALTIFREIGCRIGEASALTNLGFVRGHIGAHNEAAELNGQALTMFREIGYRLGEAEVLNEIGQSSIETGAPQDALAMFSQALGLADSIHSQREQARALEGIARCNALLGDLPTAVARLRGAIDIYRRLSAPETPTAEAYLATLETRTT